MQTSCSEQLRGEQWGEQQASVSGRGEQAGTVVALESSPNNGEQARDEQRRRYFPTNKRSPGNPSSQWLKNILPATLIGT